MAPVVDGLEAEYSGKVGVRDINANLDETAAKFDVQAVPTCVFLDSSGRQIEQFEGGDPEKLRDGFRKASGG